MRIDIGPNTVTNANGIVRVEGEDQVCIEIGEGGERLLLTMDVYDSRAVRVAELRRNSWEHNEQDRYAVAAAPASLRLVDGRDGSVVVEVEAPGRDHVRVPRGRFYTVRGDLLEITPRSLRVGGVRTRPNRIHAVGKAKAILLDPGAVGVGSSRRSRRRSR